MYTQTFVLDMKSELETEFNQIKTKQNDIEQYGRRCNILLNNVKLKKRVVAVLNTLLPMLLRDATLLVNPTDRETVNLVLSSNIINLKPQFTVPNRSLKTLASS